ncbi:MAG: electron transfer flavoprotein subunit beta/FixA family protein [Syntrophales bacterium]|jgi:electron transfer flavoprotein beta subunit|nr:electron transfer flavoprotein subunit beta/FixA family protein [Syntrophales bacterium]
MLKLVVCIKQVPQVSELPWDPDTGRLKRELAEGMMNPACRFALEAALKIRDKIGARITAVTMGPPSAEEVLREAIALGADKGFLISDRKMAGSDTYTTSLTLAKAIQKNIPEFDLILCGASTNDSATAQVGPQLAEELDIPGVAYVNDLEITGNKARVRRTEDDFIETMEMELPGLATINTGGTVPRYVSMRGFQAAFAESDIVMLDAASLGLNQDWIGAKGSATKMRNVYSPMAGKENVVLTGTTKKILDQLFMLFDDRIGGVIGKDLKTDKS